MKTLSDHTFYKVLQKVPLEESVPPKFAANLVKISTFGSCAHYVMVSKFQWKPFWLATQRDPQNDWTATQNGVTYDVFAQAPLLIQI